MPSAKPTSAFPSIRQLALDHIYALAERLRTSNRALTREQAVAEVVKTAEGAQAYALYKSEGAELPWPRYIHQAVEKSTHYRARKAPSAPKTTAHPTDALYQTIRERAMAAAPKGTSEANAVSAFLQTSEGAALWRQYNAARHAEGNA